MKAAPIRLCFWLLITATMYSCGSPGVPEPPELELARPVHNLQAIRKGNEVRLTWTAPSETTDHKTFRHLGPTQVCRSVASPVRECVSVAELPTPELRSAGRRGSNRKDLAPTTRTQAAYTDRLSPELEMQSPTSDLFYAVNVLNSYGRSAGLSNEVHVPAAPVLPPPADLRAEVTSTGVKLSWSAVTPNPSLPELLYHYRVYRHDLATNQDAIAGEAPVANQPAAVLLDSSFEWEKTYDYRLTVVTSITKPSGAEQVEGDDSAAIRVFAHDVFPPAAPTGLQAVFSGPGQKAFIDLVWAANDERDLAGYNVYRRESDGEAPQKISSELLKAPAMRDPNISPGHEYSYSVTAVDLRGNESPRSEEAHESVPANQ